MFSFVSFLCAKEKKRVCFFAPKKRKDLGQRKERK